MASTEFPGRKETVIAYLTAIDGLGSGLGPVIGANLYAVFGFDVSFYIFGVVMLLFALVLYCLPRHKI